jgi:hypothetical protein
MNEFLPLKMLTAEASCIAIFFAAIQHTKIKNGSMEHRTKLKCAVIQHAQNTIQK